MPRVDTNSSPTATIRSCVALSHLQSQGTVWQTAGCNRQQQQLLLQQHSSSTSSIVATQEGRTWVDSVGVSVASKHSPLLVATGRDSRPSKTWQRSSNASHRLDQRNQGPLLARHHLPHPELPAGSAGLVSTRRAASFDE